MDRLWRARGSNPLTSKLRLSLRLGEATFGRPGGFRLRHQHPYPRGCNSDLAQYSITPSLRAAGFEDEDESDEPYEAGVVDIGRARTIR